MQQLFIQTTAFALIGAVVYGLARVLRCRVEPGTISHARQRSWGALLVVAVSMAGLSALMLLQRLTHAPVPGSKLEFKTVPDIWLMILLGVIVYVLPAGCALWKERERLASAGVSRRNLWQAWVIGVALAALACCNRPTVMADKLAGLSGSQWGLLVFFGMVGFGEEFLFRGYLQTRLMAWLGWRRGWLLASLVFALVHVPPRLLIGRLGLGEAVLAALGLLPVSLLLGFLMLRVQNVVAPALFHTFANWASEVL